MRLPNGRAPHLTWPVGKYHNTEDDAQEDVVQLREWIGRLEAFSKALDGLEGESPSDFCESACDAWKNIAVTDSPSPTSQAVLIITESFAVLTKVMTNVSADWADTPDVRDRLTRSDVEHLLRGWAGGPAR